MVIDGQLSLKTLVILDLSAKSLIDEPFRTG